MFLYYPETETSAFLPRHPRECALGFLLGEAESDDYLICKVALKKKKLIGNNFGCLIRPHFSYNWLYLQFRGSAAGRHVGWGTASAGPGEACADGDCLTIAEDSDT